MKRRKQSNGSTLHFFFDVGVIIKGIDGVLEILGAFLIFFIQPEKIANWIIEITSHELSRSSHDFIAVHSLKAAHHLELGAQAFAAIYLGSHGVLKVLLVWALLREKLWAYPVAIIVFFGFGVYQMYRYSIDPSTSMIALTALDVFVIVLTWFEYRRLKKEA